MLFLLQEDGCIREAWITTFTVHPPPHKMTWLMVRGSYIRVWVKMFKMGLINRATCVCDVRAIWLS